MLVPASFWTFFSELDPEPGFPVAVLLVPFSVALEADLAVVLLAALEVDLLPPFEELFLVELLEADLRDAEA